MLNRKNLAALSIVCLLGSNQARAEVLVGDSASELRCGEFVDSGRLVHAERTSERTADAVGFDLNYRAVPLALTSDFNSKLFQEVSPVNVESTVASTQSASAFGYSAEFVTSTEASCPTDGILSVTPIPPAGTALEPVSTFGIFTQRWKRASSGELNGSHVNTDGRYTADAVKSSGMPLIGYTTVSASVLGLMLGVFRRGFGSNQSK